MISLSQICSLLRGGIAERGGVRVGHRIIEINNQSVVAVSHDKIVNLLATSVGEVSPGLKCRCPLDNFLLIPHPDPDENDANVDVPIAYWTGKSNLYLSHFIAVLAGEQKSQRKD